MSGRTDAGLRNRGFKLTRLHGTQDNRSKEVQAENSIQHFYFHRLQNSVF